MRPPVRTATALAAALLLAAGGLTVTPSPAAAAVTSYIRLNQVGYQTGQPKIAYLMGTAAQAGATFRVVDANGTTVRTGTAGASRGGWNSAYTGVSEIDFSAVTTPGRYTIQISGVTTSPEFEIAGRADLYAPVSRAMSTFFQTQRDGQNVIPGALDRRPSHLADSSATVYHVPTFEEGSDAIAGNLTPISGAPKVDVAGGWFDAGDYLKFTHTTAYAAGALQVAQRSGSADPARAAEIDHAMAWLDKMWDETNGVLYVQVGLGGGNDTFDGDHDVWRLPEADDAIRAEPGKDGYYLRYRPVLRANAPGARISPNLAGRVSAAFALSAQLHATSDPGRAAQDLAKAALLYQKAQTTNVPAQLVTAYPYTFYPEKAWKDDMAYGATELARAARALGDGRAVTWLAEAALWADQYMDDGGGTLNLYDVGGIALPDLAEEIAETESTGLAVTPEQLLDHQAARLDEAVARAQADRFRAGAAYTNYDSTSYTLGLIAQATRYDEVSGTSTYAAFAQSQANWALGGNPWGVSLIVGVGDTFPRCPHHQVANLKGSHTGSGAILTGAAVNGPNGEDTFDLDELGDCPADGADAYAAFTGNGARFLDATEAWMSNEPAIDFTATGLLAFALLGKGGTGPEPVPVKRDTIGVFRPSASTVFVRDSLTTGTATAQATVPSGAVGFVGDWDGDGVDGIGYWVPSSRMVHLRNAFSGGGAYDHTFQASYASSSDVPLVGDWDGNGTDTFATWRPGDRNVRIRNDHGSGATQIGVTIGDTGDTILVGDWNGDGKDSLGYHRTSQRTFVLREKLESGAPEVSFVYGATGDKPVVGDWDGDGDDTVGVFRTENSWFLRNTNASGNADVAGFTFGQSADRPLAGDFVRDAPPGTGTPAQIAAANGFYTDPDSNPMRWVADNPADARMPAIRDTLATKPGARWFGDWSGDIRTAVDAYVDGATAAGQVPILVAYNIPKRDCDGQSAGGAASAAAYRQWISEFGAGVAGRPAVVVIEPDAVTQLDCLTAAQVTERFGLVSHAVGAFGGQAWTYVDAGNAGWVAADVMADRLAQAGIARAHGFAVNTSNFWTTAESTAYANAINADLATAKPYVIDTSRNGNGHKDDWCNPAGVKLGVTSRLNTSGAEMLLWLKVPGDSDGATCGRIRDLPAGTFSPDYAMWLINGN
ncbi:glycoside hydrolase family 9 protein [Catenuloplanes atrovinosus]|uniref:Glucanase n=1 Tax=Catenuloplanes atrovinosus TaxID=137266 RepID=A0AAE3YRJ6_9ACTN|nr:glycoside hydrolase family 9 protein [Catenuloplanes atrovinosus]MDR7277375.1 endoglucanase [Catenuloplanes atrovinosus]